MDPHPFDRVFAPRSIAVFGADDDESVGGRVLRNIAAAGFAGALHAIHPRRDEVAGVRCRRSLQDVEGVVDLAVIATPTSEMRELVRACGERGVAGAIIPVGVSPDMGRDGGDAAFARGLLEEAARHGLRLLGPNSVGIVRPAAHLNATFSNGSAAPGSLALVSQSGAICTTILDWAAAHRIGFSAVASLGDAADVDFGEVLEYLALDAETKSVLLYVERVRSARSFLTGLRVAARLKPVVVVRAGRHPVNAADRGAPVMADDAFDAALARAGAVRVPSIEQMFAAAQLLGMRRQVAGNRLAILTNARGPGLLAADRAADLGVVVAALANATRGKLDELLPPVGSHANPVDLLGDAQPARYRAAVETCLADPGVDAVLAMLAPQALARPLETAEAVIAASRGTEKPLLACWMGEELVAASRALFVSNGVPEFAMPESAVEAFSHLASYRRNQRLLRQVPGPLSPDGVPQVDLARDVVERALEKGRDQLTTAEIRKLLAAFGIRLATSPADRVVRGIELYASVVRDATFGPVIRFGLGGSAVGLTRERIVALPPLNTAIIQTLIQASPLASALAAGRGMSTAEVAAVERTLWALSELVCELPEVRQLEIHPLVPNRSEMVAFDARVLVARAAHGADRYGHMAIHPYPSHIRARWQLADGTGVTVRPIRPEDAEMEASFVRKLSQSSRYFRFMVALRELSQELLIRFTQIDYDRELALLALVERDGAEIEIAVARYVMAPDGRSAHVAIAVADEWQGKGVGARLFQLLIDAARARGIARLEGEILSENAPVRALLKRLGFTIRRDPESPSTCLVEKELA